MIKFNRTTEYGLMALRHMSRKQSVDASEVTSAREVADTYGLPFEITAKTLLRLKDSGLIHSAHGAKGGYTLQRPLTQISLAEFLALMEGRQSVVACAGDQAHNLAGCEYGTRCEIKQVMGRLNDKVTEFLSGIQLAEITSEFAYYSFNKGSSK
jgi:Rrf2 family protein